MPTMRKITNPAEIAKINAVALTTERIKLKSLDSAVKPDMDMYSTIVLKKYSARPVSGYVKK